MFGYYSVITFHTLATGKINFKYQIRVNFGIGVMGEGYCFRLPSSHVISHPARSRTLPLSGLASHAKCVILDPTGSPAEKDRMKASSSLAGIERG